MSAARAGRDAGAHPFSWLIGCVLVGWLIVYNIVRIAGSTPSDAAWFSLALGGGVGAGVFALGLLALRRLRASGRVLRHGADEIPSAAAMTYQQRRITRAVAPVFAALAAVALLMGVALGTDWFTAPAGDRAVTLIVLAAWNLLVAVWIGDEAARLFRHDAEGIESVPLGAALTAVLAGVGLARDYLAPGQMVLTVVAGVAGVAAALVVWRLRGSRTPPVAAVVVAVTAALALILPFAT